MHAAAGRRTREREECDGGRGGEGLEVAGGESKVSSREDLHSLSAKGQK